MNVAENGLADVLPCTYINALHVEPKVIIDFNELAATQEKDTELVRLKSSSSSLIHRDMPLPMSDSTIACNVSKDAPHP